MTIEAAIADLREKLLSLNGMRSAPVNPPDATAAFPFGVSYERSGTLEMKSAGFANDLATIWCEIHVSRQILPQAVALAMEFRDPFMKLLIADPTLGGTVSTIREIRRTFGRLEWGGVETIGYRFEVDVKVTLTT